MDNTSLHHQVGAVPIDRTRKLASVAQAQAPDQQRKLEAQLKAEQDASNRAMIIEHLQLSPRPLLFFPEV
jgi:hypothetical protein